MIRNEYIRGSLGIVSIKNKTEENCVRWFGHIYRRPEQAVEKGAKMFKEKPK